MAHLRQKSEQGKATSGRTLLSMGTALNGDSRALAFFGIVLLTGGAGVGYPLLWWIILMLAAGVVGVTLSRHPWPRLPTVARAALWLAAGYWLLLITQILPLPKGLWMMLPGHAVAADVAQAGNIEVWRAWSLAPARTLENLLDALPPLAAVLLLATAPTRRRVHVLRLIVAVAIANALLGVTQFGAGADAAPIFYGTTHRGVAVGFFVNRNHVALFLMIAMLLAVLPGVVRLGARDDGPVVQAARAILVAVLGLAVLTTLSRSGVFLLPIALVAAFLLARTQRLRVQTVVMAGAGCLIGTVLFAQTPPARALFKRYAFAADDARFDYWANTWLAVRDAFPLGTGYGTFQNVYRTFEPLNQVGPATVNRAHNDFLEILLVGGFGGVVLMLAAIGIACHLIVIARRGATNRFERRTPLAVAIGLALIAGASVVDYPLHGAAMGAIAGALLGLLGQRPVTQDRHTSVRSRPYVPLCRNLGLIVLALWGSAVCWSQHLVFSGRPGQAARIQPLNSRAWALLANERQIAGDAGGASAAARRALALDPLDAGAVRAEAVARLQQGDEAGGVTLLGVGARLGWRDTFTQFWLVQQALAAGAPDFAVQRIDALLRMRVLFDQVIVQLPPLISQKSGRRALAEQLGFDPGWRVAFFNTAAVSKDYELSDMLALLAELNRGPAPVRPEETALVRAVLGDEARFGDARQIWLASGGKGEIADPGFERQRDFTVSTGPYVWQAARLTGVSVHADEAAAPLAGRAVAISSSGLASGAALTQTLALRPGRYHVGLSVVARNDAVARGVSLSLECLGGQPTGEHSSTAPRSLSDGSTGVLSFDWHARGRDMLVGTGMANVDRNCVGQRLAILIPSQDSGPYSLWIDNVVVNAAR